MSASCRPLRPFGRHVLAGDQVEDGLGDIGGVIADPLDVLRAEQKMGAEGDLARILHHVGQQFAEDASLPGRRARRRAARRRARARCRAGRKRRARPSGGPPPLRPSARCRRCARGTRASAPISIARLAMFLARSPTRSRSPASGSRDDLAQVDGHRLAPRDRQDRLLLDLALEQVEPGRRR